MALGYSLDETNAFNIHSPLVTPALSIVALSVVIYVIYVVRVILEAS
jgi:hypothetical protein